MYSGFFECECECEWSVFLFGDFFSVFLLGDFFILFVFVVFVVLGLLMKSLGMLFVEEVIGGFFDEFVDDNISINDNGDLFILKKEN